MSWSVNASGNPQEVKESLSQQFSYPLAEGDAGLPDAGEKETVRRVKGLIEQCLGTFDPGRTVTVDANGHMGFEDYEKRTGACQHVNLSIA